MAKRLTPVGWLFVGIVLFWAGAIWFFPKISAVFLVVCLVVALIITNYATGRAKP